MSETYGPSAPTKEELEQYFQDKGTQRVFVSVIIVPSADKPQKPFDPEQEKKEWELARREQLQKLERDSWMVDLPPQLSSSLNFDLMQKNRTFSKRGVEDRGDSSDWTADPQTKAQRPKTSLQMAKEMALANVAKQRDEEAAVVVKEYNEKHRNESLLNIHLSKATKGSDNEDSSTESEHDKKSKQKKRKSKNKKRKREEKEKTSKKKKKQADTEDREEKKEYVPFFDRDRDVVAPQVDSKKRNEIIARSTVLHSRFSSGSSSSFL